MTIRWAIRELLKSRRQLAGVFFILIIGFLGPLLSSSLETSVDRYLEVRARQLLSADLALANVREFKPEELAVIDKVTSETRRANSAEFVTMGKGRDVSTLIEIQAVDEGFPIFGIFKFLDGHEIASAAELSRSDIAWVFPELLAQLGLKVGDDLSVGSLNVRIAGVLKEAPGLSRGGVFAPRAFIGRNRLARTGLTDLGSQAQYRVYLKLPNGESAQIAGARAKDLLNNDDITVRTPDDATAGFERFFTFFNLYLVSVSMIIFALSWISSFYILQIYLQERLRNSAVLLTFGATKARALTVSALQIFFIMLTSLVAASIIVFAIILVAAPSLADVLPPGFEILFTARDFSKLLVISIASSLAFLVPSAMKMQTSPLTDLLNETSAGLTHKRTLLAYSPLALVFVGLSIWLMNSARNAVLLTGGLVIAVAIGYALARTLFKAVFASVRAKPGVVRLVATQLSRSRFGTNLCFITILIGTLVLNAVPHLMTSAVREIEPLQGRDVPSLFLFNIPESGVENLKAFAAPHEVELRYLAPMVQARIKQVNGKPPENETFQKFPVRLTYRNALIKSEKLLRGQMPAAPVAEGQRVAVSIEDGYAERTGLRMGDDLTFEVQGVPVEAKITSVRSVKWTDFNPNFFMVLQPGAIDDAPKTYLSAVHFKSPQVDKSKVQYDLVREFPDISVLDIGRTIEKVLEIVRSIVGPVRVAAGVAVLMSFLILIGVISHNLSLRRPELDIQKLLGADRQLIRRMIVGEYVILGLGASLLGAAFAIAMTALVTAFIFEVPMRIDLTALLVSVAGTLLLTSALSYFVATRVLGRSGASTKL